MKDKREPILIFKGKDINLIMDALETQVELEQESKLRLGYIKLYNKIKEVMRIE